MTTYLLSNGNLLVPRRAEGKGLLGDGMIEVKPGEPDFEKWRAWFKRTGNKPLPAPVHAQTKAAQPKERAT